MNIPSRSYIAIQYLLAVTNLHNIGETKVNMSRKGEKFFLLFHYTRLNVFTDFLVCSFCRDYVCNGKQ